jgi:alcohol dehydrogenase/propanol-preferring alcohol dehydrogenase
MRSYQIVEYGAPLRLAQREAPEPQGTEILVRVLACGVCHTDVHLRDGCYDLGKGKKLDLSQLHRLPLTLGHEIVGEVAALGPEASGVSVGDRRIVYPWIGCGACGVCLSGRDNLCLTARYLGTRVDGGYSDHVLVPHPRYLFDCSGIDEALACTYACSGLTAYSALKKVAPLTEGDVLVIIGAGGLGLMATRLAGAVVNAKLAVCDIDARKREAARQAGARHVIDPNDEGARERVVEITNGGAWTVIDFVGAPSSAQFGMDVLRKGGRLVVVGLYGGAISISLLLMPLRAKSIVGSFVGTLTELQELLTLVEGGEIAPIPIETRSLERADETVDDLKAGRIVGRAVLVP